MQHKRTVWCLSGHSCSGLGGGGWRGRGEGEGRERGEERELGGGGVQTKVCFLIPILKGNTPQFYSHANNRIPSSLSLKKSNFKHAVS